ncbi:hypothetical protein PENANT_c011G07844 [Penicillium antarcticum]|uniref:Protein required for cell viability Rrp17 n=1 Tax=Penicillium antarcticum TaxID=416450 RepID=A0A1V6Q7W5_9EURO|nr:uncharacterized protein N7508_003087 [Penicillium antarcticum]KAJ5312257.1 hypothetical protein N7508_003087 [Penicillium antarcticum]OQD85092.1 hypothetical protein PENANT_c011G07844 [Penicillium antarcticum]
MGPPQKRRKVAQPKVEEINFNTEDRQEWLTGFHKRKLQRAKHAQDAAEKRYKEEKRADRKKLREERQADFKRAMEEHARVLKQMKENAGEKSESDDENEEEWDGIEEPPAVDYEAEYIDEDKYTTVTVEEMDPSREGLLKAVMGEDSETEEKKEYPAADAEDDKKPKRKTGERIARKKKRNFRYESKDVRRQTARKQRAVKSNKAKARRGAESEK